MGLTFLFSLNRVEGIISWSITYFLGENSRQYVSHLFLV